MRCNSPSAYFDFYFLVQCAPCWIFQQGNNNYFQVVLWRSCQFPTSSIVDDVGIRTILKVPPVPVSKTISTHFYLQTNLSIVSGNSAVSKWMYWSSWKGLFSNIEDETTYLFLTAVQLVFFCKKNTTPHSKSDKCFMALPIIRSAYSRIAGTM